MFRMCICKVTKTKQYLMLIMHSKLSIIIILVMVLFRSFLRQSADCPGAFLPLLLLAPCLYCLWSECIYLVGNVDRRTTLLSAHTRPVLPVCVKHFNPFGGPM